MGTMKHILLTQYHERMGAIHFPDGFEAHLKKLVSDYEQELPAAGEAIEDGLFRSYLLEYRVKNIVQQMRCYGWTEYERPVKWDDPRLVAETPDPELQKKIQPLMTNRDSIRLIVKENMVVGVTLEDAVGYSHSGDDYFYLTKELCILPNCRYVSSSTSDNNGAGYKERDWYKYLICLPYNHNLW